jgi:predicted transcriptional regulator
MPLSRITITIPDELIGQADRKAAALDRSRSWVLVDALRRYLAAPVAAVREPSVDYAAGLDAARAAQLAADLRMTPEERVLAAERTLRVDAQRGRAPLHDRVLSFDRYEDYLDWERREAVRA